MCGDVLIRCQDDDDARSSRQFPSRAVLEKAFAPWIASVLHGNLPRHASICQCQRRWPQRAHLRLPFAVRGIELAPASAASICELRYLKLENASASSFFRADLSRVVGARLVTEIAVIDSEINRRFKSRSTTHLRRSERSRVESDFPLRKKNLRTVKYFKFLFFQSVFALLLRGKREPFDSIQQQVSRTASRRASVYEL